MKNLDGWERRVIDELTKRGLCGRVLEAAIYTARGYDPIAVERKMKIGHKSYKSYMCSIYSALKIGRGVGIRLPVVRFMSWVSTFYIDELLRLNCLKQRELIRDSLVKIQGSGDYRLGVDNWIFDLDESISRMRSDKYLQLTLERNSRQMRKFFSGIELGDKN